MNREAILFPGQGLSPDEIINFHKKLQFLDHKISDRFVTAAQLALNQIHGSAEFNVLSSLSDIASPNFYKTAFTQPIIYGLCVAAYEFRRDELNPVLVAGHSLGEYASLAAAGVFEPEKGMKIVSFRGKFMQDACEDKPSKLISLMGADLKAIEDICSYGIAEIALINAPGLIVLGCAEEAVPRVNELAKEHGVKKTTVLQTAGAFHTRFMGQAAERLKSVLSAYIFQEIQIPVVANLTGRVVKAGVYPVENLVSSMTNPVQWAETIATMFRQVEMFVESGPGSSLQGLNGINRIPKEKSRNILD